MMWEEDEIRDNMCSGFLSDFLLKIFKETYSKFEEHRLNCFIKFNVFRGLMITFILSDVG